MRQQEVDKVLADEAFWKELGDRFGWVLHGWTYRRVASFYQADMATTFEVTRYMHDSITSALGDGL